MVVGISGISFRYAESPRKPRNGAGRAAGPVLGLLSSTPFCRNIAQAISIPAN
jgi:hypothetical protein